MSHNISLPTHRYVYVVPSFVLRDPLRTALMAFPEGGRLFFIDTFGALLTLPVQWAAGTVAAYNAAVFGAFVAAGVAAWAFARHVVARTGHNKIDADARGRLRPGSSRASVTTANARWANAAERRDRSLDALTAECSAMLHLEAKS
jgi:hypothetical protein